VCSLEIISAQGKKKGQHFYVGNRMEWEGHIKKSTSEGSDAFQWMYRMEYSAFLNLCTIIHPQIQVNTEMSRCRAIKSPIIVEIVLRCFLCCLDVGSYFNIKLCADFSSAVEVHQCNFELWIIGMKVSSHCCTGLFIAKLSGCNKGVLHVYMGLLQIQVSSSSETGNVKTHFSGHYQIYRINVEAACD